MSTQAVTPSSAVEAPRLYTPAEVAKILKVSVNTVIQRFEKVKGVIDLGSAEDLRKHKRRYRVLRIPHESLQRFLAENRVQ